VGQPVRAASGSYVGGQGSAAGLERAHEQPQQEAKALGGPLGLWARWIQWWADVLDDTGEDKRQTSPRKASEVLGKLWQLLLPEWKLMAVAFAFGLTAACVELAIPHYVSKAIFAVTKEGSEALFKSHLTMLAACCTGYAAFAGVRALCFALLNMRLVRSMRSELFRKLVERDITFFDQEEVGTLTSRLGADCQTVARLVGFHVNVMVRNLLQCLGGAIYLVILSPPLALSCGVVTGMLWGVTLWYSSISRKLSRSAQDALADTTQVAEEVLTLMRTVRTFGTEKQELERYQGSLQNIVNIAVRYCTAYAMYLTSSSFLFNATKVVTLGFGGMAALNGTITPEQLTAFVLYIEFVTSASIAVGEQYSSVMEAVGSTEKVIGLMEAGPAPQISKGEVPDRCHGKLELRDVCYTYPSRPNSPALQNVTLTINPGQLTALVGLSGSGKSTVMGLLQRLHDPSSGEVLLDGHPLDQLDSAWYRRKLGVVSQEPKLFTTDIASNISYGMDASQEEIEAAARASNAHGFISALPEGYSTHLSSGTLSGGQKQRVVIARALLRKPSILLLDEATSALDAESEALVQETLDGVMQASQGKQTVVVIAHRLQTVRNAHKIIVMDHGSIVEAGTHVQLCAMRGVYWDLLRRQNNSIAECDYDISPGSIDMDDHKLPLSIRPDGINDSESHEETNIGNVEAAHRRREGHESNRQS